VLWEQGAPSYGATGGFGVLMISNMPARNVPDVCFDVQGWWEAMIRVFTKQYTLSMASLLRPVH
jgi:hypothetical protein